MRFIFGTGSNLKIVVPRRAAYFFSSEATQTSSAAVKQLPLRPLPVIPRFYQSKPRLHAHWKLRPARKLKDIAAFITLLRLDFDPADEGTSGCKELRRQATAPSARAAFPKCVIECDERTDGKPAVVTVKWSDGSTQIVQAANTTLLDILDSLYSKAQTLQRIEEDRDM